MIDREENSKPYHTGTVRKTFDTRGKEAQIAAMGEIALDSGKQDVKNEVQVAVTSVKEDEKDKAISGKPPPTRILRYAEV